VSEAPTPTDGWRWKNLCRCPGGDRRLRGGARDIRLVSRPHAASRAHVLVAMPRRSAHGRAQDQDRSARRPPCARPARHDRFPTIWVPDPPPAICGAPHPPHALGPHPHHGQEMACMLSLNSDSPVAPSSSVSRPGATARLALPRTGAAPGSKPRAARGLTTQIRELDDAITTAALGHPDAHASSPPRGRRPDGVTTIVCLGPRQPLPRQQARGSYVGLARPCTPPPINITSPHHQAGQPTPALRLGQAATRRPP